MYQRIPKEKLERLYVVVGLTMEQIAEQTGVSRPTLERWRKEYGIPTVQRTPPLIGQRFGGLVVSEEIHNGGHGIGIKLKCICDCGNEITIARRNLSKQRNCGCLQHQDMLGQRFSKLVTVKFIRLFLQSGKCPPGFICQCDCGNTTKTQLSDLLHGKAKSCGCTHTPPDLKGQKFNMLTVLETFRKKIGPYNHILYRCQCDCGKETTVYRVALVSGSTKSCGCSKVVTIPNGTQFGRLTVTAKVKVKGGFAYECLCSCGNKHTVQGAILKLGLTKSCGCLMYDPEGTPKGQAGLNLLLTTYKTNAKNHNHEMTLTDFQMTELFQQNCFYCGAPPSSIKCKTEHGRYLYSGLDRIDNTKGYIPENVVPACWNCNRAKRNLSVEDFITWVKRIKNPRGSQKPPLAKHLPISRSLYSRYKHGAETRKLSFLMSLEEMSSMFVSSCAYCGQPPSNHQRKHHYTGIDRLDNTKGYETSNCVPACRNCNTAKGKRTLEDFLTWAARIQKYQATVISIK